MVDRVRSDKDFIAAHPIAALVLSSGKLYETESVRLLRKYFYEALNHNRAYYVYGAPGTQKTYVLQHLIAKLNRSEIAKNGNGGRAYYVYVRQGIRSLDLMKRVAESCGAFGIGTVDRILRNLRFDLSQRKVLLVFESSAWRRYGNYWINHPTAGCCSLALTSWRKSSPARRWSWSNGVPAFMPFNRCRASLTKKQ